MPNAVVTLKKGAGRTLKEGGPWIYDNEIESIMGSFTDGDIVLVHDFDGYPLGRGFINRNSKLTVRMMTRNRDTEVDESFIRMRVKNAWEYRKKVMDDISSCRVIFGEADFLPSSCRVIFGEADFLPGLVVDKFADVLVVESLALGIDRFKVMIVDILKELMEADGIHIRGVYERSDAKVREQEGMERYKGFIGAPFDTKVEIVENGVHYYVDVKDGQKTGFFLDQKYNRRAAAKLCKGARVPSELGVAQARENAALNGLEDRVEFICEDVFDLLPRLEKQGEKFDVVILDPPAFTKSRSSIKKAVKGYREINLRGMKLVKDGGYLATCSCSHFMDPELFTQTIGQAARNVHKRLRQVEFRTQSPDHPILWGAGDSYYLKFYIFQVCDEK